MEAFVRLRRQHLYDLLKAVVKETGSSTNIFIHCWPNHCSKIPRLIRGYFLYYFYFLESFMLVQSLPTLRPSLSIPALASDPANSKPESLADSETIEDLVHQLQQSVVDVVRQIGRAHV